MSESSISGITLPALQISTTWNNRQVVTLTRLEIRLSADHTLLTLDGPTKLIRLNPSIVTRLHEVHNPDTGWPNKFVAHADEQLTIATAEDRRYVRFTRHGSDEVQYIVRANELAAVLPAVHKKKQPKDDVRKRASGALAIGVTQGGMATVGWQMVAGATNPGAATFLTLTSFILSVAALATIPATLIIITNPVMVMDPLPKLDPFPPMSGQDLDNLNLRTIKGTLEGELEQIWGQDETLQQASTAVDVRLDTAAERAASQAAAQARARRSEQALHERVRDLIARAAALQTRVTAHEADWDSVFTRPGFADPRIPTAAAMLRAQKTASRLAEYIDPAVGITDINADTVGELQDAVEAAESTTQIAWDYAADGTDVYARHASADKPALDRVAASYRLFKDGTTEAERAAAARALRTAAQKANIGAVAAGRAVFSVETMRGFAELGQ